MYETEITDNILVTEITKILNYINEDKEEGYFIILKHACDLSTYLNIGEEVNKEEDLIHDGPLDKWIDTVIYLIEEDSIEELKELIVKCLVDIEKFEVIVELKRLEVL